MSDPADSGAPARSQPAPSASLTDVTRVSAQRRAAGERDEVAGAFASTERVAARRSTPSALDEDADVYGHETVVSVRSASSEAFPVRELDRRAALRRGDSVGRLVILGTLGAGGMGVVYAAYDPQLDRKVALKMLHTDRAHLRDARLRLEREAQALAKLSHPNIVGVHDVGVHEGWLWMSMEFVDGVTLTSWLRERDRGWAEILEIMKAATQGVSAAHEAGLLHRDIKPDNIMIGRDERVRVMDFGLARADAARAEPSCSSMAHAEFNAGRSAFDATLTVDGAFMGTPAYMAPEQFAGAELDARTDVFSLCATLWRALYGQRAFEGETIDDLKESVSKGELRAPPADASVPLWLRRALERGLSSDADARYPSADALLERLNDDPAVRRRRLASRAGIVSLLAGGGVLVAAGVTALAWWVSERRERARCERTGARARWDEERARELRAAFMATELEYAADTWERAAARLEAWTASWRDARVRACNSARAGVGVSVSAASFAEICLDRQAWQFAGTVEILRAADEALVTRAVPMVAGLPPASACDDAGAQIAAAAASASEVSAEELNRVREQLALVAVDERAGRYERALSRAEAARAEAEALADEVLRAEALATLGSVQAASGAYEAAETTLRDAFFLASRIGHDPIVASAGASLVKVVGYDRGRAEQGYDWAEHARAATRRMGMEPGPRLLEFLGYAQAGAGAYEDAVKSFERALALRVETLGPEHPGLAETLGDLGVMHAQLADYARSTEFMTRALELNERALGPSHPVTARHLYNFGGLERLRGRLGPAAALLRRARAIQEVSLGPEHSELADTLRELGRVLRQQGELEEARALHERALAIALVALGEHSDTAGFRTALGKTLERAGALDEALIQHRKGLELRERLLGPEHPDLAESLNSVGVVLARVGLLEEALPRYRRALELGARAFGEEHAYQAATLDNIGVALTELGRPGEALELHERALAIRERALDPGHLDFAASRDCIGLALLRAGEAARAVASHERALVVREATGGPDHKLTGETHQRLSEALRERGELAAALRHGERALEIASATPAAAPDVRARALISVGRALLELARPGEASSQLEDAVALTRDRALDPKITADASFHLARALALDEDARGRARAVELARAAVEGYAALGVRAEAERADAATWLSSHHG